jgi:hypothetical protein
MKKNTTTLATLALAILDSMINSVEETPQTTETIPTTSPSNSPIMYGTSRESFGETDVVHFLVDEVGMKLKSSSAEYPSTAKMLCMSTDEVRQIMSYCDELKAKAEFGDKVLKSVQMLKGLFK